MSSKARKLDASRANVPAAYRSPGAQQGFRTSLDRCAAYVASLTRKE